MNHVLGYLDFCIVFIDDIAIFSDSMLNNINPDKSQWFAEKVKLRGFMLSKQGINLDPYKIKALLEKKPKNK